MSAPGDTPAWLRDALTDLARAQARSEERFTAVEAQVARLAATQERADGRLEAVEAELARHRTLLERLAETQAQTTALLAQHNEWLGRLDARLDEQSAMLVQHSSQLGRLEPQLSRVSDQLDTATGWAWETRVRERAASYLADVADHVQVLTPEERDRLLDPAVLVGALTRDEARDLQRADLICRVNEPARAEQRLLVAEVAAHVALRDVARVAAYAGLLARLGVQVLAVVIGQRIGPDAQTAAPVAGVRVLLSTDTRARAILATAVPAPEPAALPGPVSPP
jgi:hypothetical protein